MEDTQKAVRKTQRKIRKHSRKLSGQAREDYIFENTGRVMQLNLNKMRREKRPHRKVSRREINERKMDY